MRELTTMWGDPRGPQAEGTRVGRTSPAVRDFDVPASAMTRLLRTIEGEIIPRLLMAHQSAPAEVATEGVAQGRAAADDVTEFARLVVTHDLSVAAAFVQALLARGVTLERVYLELLAPAARLLGEWWKQDLRDFTEVTSGLSRMRRLLHEFNPDFMADSRPADVTRRVLLVPMPGEQHSFGLILVGEFFRRAGWDVWDMYPGTAQELAGIVRAQAFSIIGVSLSCGSRLDEVPDLIRGIRTASRNRAAGLMVGGAPFLEDPRLVSAVGADATASDARRAPVEASGLLLQLANRV